MKLILQWKAFHSSYSSVIKLFDVRYNVNKDTVVSQMLTVTDQWRLLGVYRVHSFLTWLRFTDKCSYPCVRVTRKISEQVC